MIFLLPLGTSNSGRSRFIGLGLVKIKFPDEVGEANRRDVLYLDAWVGLYLCESIRHGHALHSDSFPCCLRFVPRLRRCLQELQVVAFQNVVAGDFLEPSPGGCP